MALVIWMIYIKRSFRYNISFIDPQLGVFGEIFPSVMTYHALQEIFRRIPRAEGL